ncbi:Hypothetical protein DEACI_4133 [Acididesulfobacillus acetoxydans]|uniref:Uncharacterized protein n=1 Tax=Acididesulfobacillus acetoxydans TaxID=1561005 RepID=A0A8S0X7H2_9FIRM|nr:hypothetical protein [Acididesulfobacillus acetoxydans]CAA7603310.1 Hypothetical protein DEACI_4133 [Acididesulfobacillus acetoxydans]
MLKSLDGMRIPVTEKQAQALRAAAGILTLIATGLIFYRAVGTVGWQTDVSWHTLNGLQILRTHSIPLTDTWTWKTPGHPWGDGEWLWDLVSAFVYLHFGWFGIRLFAVAIMEGLTFSLWRYARTLQPTSVAILVAILSGFAWITETQARPQLVSYLFFAWALLAIEKARAEGTKRPLWLFLPVLILWNNMHGSAVLWLGLIGLEMLFAWKKAKEYTGLALASLAALCVRPDPLALLHFLSRQLTPANLVISEWLSPSFHQPNQLYILALGILLIGSTWHKATLKEKCWLIFGWAAYFIAQRFSTYAVILTRVVFARAFKVPERLYRNNFLPMLTALILGIFLSDFLGPALRLWSVIGAPIAAQHQIRIF